MKSGGAGWRDSRRIAKRTVSEAVTNCTPQFTPNSGVPAALSRVRRMLNCEYGFSRIVAASDEAVTFRYTDSATQESKECISSRQNLCSVFSRHGVDR